MKVNVIKEFVDKYTGELHKVGSSFDCDANRIAEIKANGDFIAEVEEIHTTEKKALNKPNKKA